MLAAGPGQTICLESGTYGRWTGTDKRITVRPAKGSTATMLVNFGTYAAGFTLDGMSGMGGMITAGAQNITIENSRFAYQLRIDGAVTNIVVNHNDFMYPVRSTLTGPNSKIFLDATGGAPGSAATIENNDIENGDLDGIHVGGGAGMIIRNNYFNNLCDRNINHTDNIQFEGGSQTNVEGNYIYTPGPEPSTGCVAGGIDSYDGETNGVIIEDNVVDVTRDWGIELYSDNGSIVRHNTVVYHPNSYSAFNSGDGQIDIDRKSQDPAGTGTHVYDNVGTAEFNNGSTGTANNNTDPSTVTYVSPCAKGCTYGAPVVHDNYLLAPGSAGVGVADNGSNTGIFAASW